MTAILELKNIHKSFEVGTVNENHVLKGIDLTIKKKNLLQLSEEMELENQLY